MARRMPHRLEKGRGLAEAPPKNLAGQDGLTDVSNGYAAFPVAPHADMMAPGSRGGDIPLRGGWQCRDSA